MNTRFKLMFLCVMALLSSPALAGELISTQVVTNVSTGYGAEGVYVAVADGTFANRCGDPRFHIRPNHPMLKIMVAQLLLALQTGNKVDLYIEGCSAITSGNMNLEAVGIYYGTYK